MEDVVKVTHCDRKWRVIVRDGSYFVLDDQNCLTGPFSEAGQAVQWIRSIRKA